MIDIMEHGTCILIAITSWIAYTSIGILITMFYRYLTKHNDGIYLAAMCALYPFFFLAFLITKIGDFFKWIYSIFFQPFEEDVEFDEITTTEETKTDTHNKHKLNN